MAEHPAVNRRVAGSSPARGANSFPVSRRINAERLLLLAWPRAILLQLAHPLVAAGVADHSTFRSGPLAAAHRLRDTVRAMLALTFADAASRADTIAGILAIHRRVNGHLREPMGPYPAGTPYSAEDPALVLWVHATIVESMVLGYDALIGPLDDAEQDTYCAEAHSAAVDLGARAVEAPETWVALRSYIDTISRSETLVVGRDARDVAAAVLFPPRSTLIWPLARLSRLITIGMLPAPIRTLYGFPWSAQHERRFDQSTRLVRAARRRMPRRLALWAQARTAAPAARA